MEKSSRMAWIEHGTLRPWEAAATAIENLSTNKLRSALTMLGIIIGVMAVIMLVSVAEGAKRYITRELSGLGTNLLIITAGKSQTTGGPPILGEGTRKLTYEDAVAIMHATNQDDIAPVVIGGSMIKYGNRSRDVTVVGTTYAHQKVRNIFVEVGRFISDEDVESRRRVVALGRTVARELFGERNPLGTLVRIADMRFRVVGIMERKGVILGFDFDNLVFIPVRTALELYDTDRLMEILVGAANEAEIPRVTAAVTRILMRRHDNKEDFTVTSQGAMLTSLRKILNIFSWVLGAIAAISLLVGGIGIMNIMLVSVGERTREIGLRKAVGARCRDILSQVLLEALALSVIGGLIGVCAGAGGAIAVGNIFPSLPVEVSLWSIWLAFSFAVGVGIFFGVYPARKAALLDPIAALRYE
jgi:putative ABC transport system permease protein